MRNHKRIISLILATTMGLSIVGCGKEKNKSDVITTADDGGVVVDINPGLDSTETSPYTRKSFAEFSQDGKYQVVTTANVPMYSVEKGLSNVINPEDFQYELDYHVGSQDMLEKNGFVVVPSYYDEFYGVYETNRYALYPNFITTDSLVHTYHVCFEGVLKSCEKTTFSDSLYFVSDRMVQHSMEQYEQLKGTTWENAARRNVAFFTVGAKLLNPDYEIPAIVSDEVNAELALIENHSVITASPIVNMGGTAERPLEEDYTQYIPRGYYTQTEQLTRYFKAAMWYGRLSFRIAEDDELKSAILATKAMEDYEAFEKYDGIYTVTSFFVGNSDDVGIYEFTSLVGKIYGTADLNTISSDDGKLATFKQEALSLKQPAINSIPIDVNSSDEQRFIETTGFRFMGQRATFDAACFQQLIYPNVEERYLPSAMDIPAVLGSTEAVQILTEDGTMSAPNYADNLAKLQDNAKTIDEKTWNTTLYSGWIHSLEPLTVEKGEGYPMFMQNQAWSRKQLNCFLGSYAELKHDTILYAKQVYAEMGGCDEEEKDHRGYVEPEPYVYARIANLSAMTKSGLEKYGMLTAEQGEWLDSLQKIAEQLLTISNKELSNETLTDEEYEFIDIYGGYLEHIIYSVRNEDIQEMGCNMDDTSSAIIADIATDPNGYVLEVGTGNVDKIIVAVCVDGKVKLASGAVYSYYEFPHSMDDRLTDEKWREMIRNNNAPMQPTWINEFKNAQ